MAADIKKLRASSGPAGRKYGGTAASFVLLTALGLFMVFPIYLTVVMAIKPVEELFVFPPKLYAVRPTLDNFRDMFAAVRQNRVPFSRYVFNSVFVTVSVTAAQCVFASMAAFVLAKCRFPGCRIINGVIVTSLLYQSSVIYIMQYMVMTKLNIIDSPLALILPAAASPMGVFLMRQSISQIPDAMLDAAKVDGAGLFRICWQIVIPNQKPALMTLMIFAFQAAWNIQGGGVIFREQFKTLPAAVAQVSSSGMARAGVAMAASVFMLVPPVIVFILAQRYVIETMAHSGIKE
ncbi:MAG: carbohydrate ABC transporter permease [Ruminococcus sp.]|nr:carbohydrate ABC transporter permease [Ruminococcus sp.]MBQ4534468.1 carbohydrate ABC transporter permease [Ruminococcus sp.]MBR6624031.1 carbohydrate ABC transporter permease [Ruminococcus sp.]